MTHRFIFPLLGANMDFEEASLGAWIRDTNGDDASTVEPSTDKASHASQSLKMKLLGTDTYAGAYQEVSFVPEVGQTLALSFKAIASGAPGVADLDVYIYEQQGATVLFGSSLYLNAELNHLNWKPFTLKHTVQSELTDTIFIGVYTYADQNVYTDDMFCGSLWEPRGATRFDVKARIARQHNESASGEVEALSFAPHDEVTLEWKRMFASDAAEYRRFFRQTRQGEDLAFWFDSDDEALHHLRRMMLWKKDRPLAMGPGPEHYENVEIKLRSLPE